MTNSPQPMMLPCPAGHDQSRVIGGQGTAGGPKYWAGCDLCNWRAFGDTEAEAIAAWNERLSRTPTADDVEREPPHGYTRETWASKQAEVAEFSRRNPYEDEATGIERKRNSEERLRAAANIQCGDVPDQFALVRRGDIMNVLHELIRHRAGHELAIEKRKAAALAMPPADEAIVGRLREALTAGDVTDDMLNAGQSRLCELRAATYFEDDLQAEIFAAMFNARIASLPDTSATEKGE